jgi:hypothetical protein
MVHVVLFPGFRAWDLVLGLVVERRGFVGLERIVRLGVRLIMDFARLRRVALANS